MLATVVVASELATGDSEPRFNPPTFRRVPHWPP